MERKKTISPLIALSLLCATSTVDAFDGNRKGFSLGLGAGVHHLDNHVLFDGNGGVIYEGQTGIASSLKIGAGINEQFSVFYTRNASWYNVNGELAVIGLTGLGASYYLSPNVPSKYFIAGLGLGDFSTPLYDSDTDINDGSSFLVGFGYEFKKHQSVEFNLGITTHKVSSSVKLETYTAQVLFNYQFY